VHNNDMAKFLEDKNQGTPSHGISYAFLFFGNIGIPLMATLNIPGVECWATDLLVDHSKYLKLS
jgi:hypothetical protein